MLATAVVLLVLAAFLWLSIPVALLTFAALAVAIAVVPEVGDDAERSEVDAAVELAETPGIGRFADVLPDPCVLLDRRGGILHLNGPAAAQFPELAAGANITISLRSPALIEAFDAARKSGSQQTFELHRTTPLETWHRVALAPLDPTKPDVWVLTMQSLTEARRLDTMRTDFIANASHELRTPLSALVGFIDTLLGPAANDAKARERFLGVMKNQAARMTKLVEDLLSLSRIEMRQHVRPTGHVDLKLLLGEVKAGLETVAGDAGVAIELDLPDEDATVTGDRDELYEVFENLIDNAIKYGADGKRVAVTLWRASSGSVISVTDWGAGVDPMHVPRLTERFYRVDAESSRKKKGTGLGLAIVKHIVGRHRGLMTIVSQPGQGTRVEVQLPR